MAYKHVLITGATSGIGYELALLWKAKGAIVQAIGRNADSLERLNQLGISIHNLDLGTEDGIEKARELILSSKPELVIHCAGYTNYGFTCDRPWKELTHEHRLHTEAMLGLVHAQSTIARNSKEGNCCFVAISSALAYTPAAGMSIYSSGKQWMLTLCKLLNLECKPYLRVLCACPGPVLSCFHLRASSGKMQEKSYRALTSHQAAKRITKQIENGTREKPIGALAWLAKIAGTLLPTTWVAQVLLQSIKNRF